MSLRGRIARLEKALGTADNPKHVTISTAGNRHSIAWHGPNSLSLGTPCPGSPQPAGWTPRRALTDEQRALIGPNDKVVALIVPPSKRRRNQNVAGS
jgi:hypothetical protein